MCGVSSWLIAIATPAMFFPGISCHGVALGFAFADEVYIRYPFFVMFVLCGMCVSCITAMCILCLASCCVTSFCISCVTRWSGFRLAIVSVFSPGFVEITVSLFVSLLRSFLFYVFAVYFLVFPFFLHFLVLCLWCFLVMYSLGLVSNPCCFWMVFW